MSTVRRNEDSVGKNEPSRRHAPAGWPRRFGTLSRRCARPGVRDSTTNGVTRTMDRSSYFECAFLGPLDAPSSPLLTRHSLFPDTIFVLPLCHFLFRTLVPGKRYTKYLVKHPGNTNLACTLVYIIPGTQNPAGWFEDLAANSLNKDAISYTPTSTRYHITCLYVCASAITPILQIYNQHPHPFILFSRLF